MREPPTQIRAVSERQRIFSILAGVTVSLVYLGAIALIVGGLLRFVREQTRQPAPSATLPQAILGRLRFRR